MSVSLKSLVSFIDSELNPCLFQDYAPNGLQVEGNSQVKRLVSGVTACESLIDKAIEMNADAILVHHGYFWKGESQVLTGMKCRRIKKLLEHNISLLAYHLPLDAHPSMGNNAELGRLLDFTVQGGMSVPQDTSIGLFGCLSNNEEHKLEFLGDKIEKVLLRKPLLIFGGNHLVRNIAWCTGGAQNYIEKAKSLGVDTYLSGEISEQTVHFARENGIHYIAAGHHATERYGVQAVGCWIQKEFDLEYEFVEVSNPA